MAAQVLFLMSVLSSLLVSISMLFFYTEPFVILSSLIIAGFSMMVWVLLKKGSYSFLFATLTLMALHGLYYFELAASIWILIFLFVLLSLSCALDLSASMLLECSLFLQICLLPECMLTFLFAAASGQAGFYVLDFLITLYGSAFTLAYLSVLKQKPARRTLYIFSQFLWGINLVVTILLYVKMKKEEKELTADNAFEKGAKPI